MAASLCAVDPFGLLSRAFLYAAAAKTFKACGISMCGNNARVGVWVSLSAFDRGAVDGVVSCLCDSQYSA